MSASNSMDTEERASQTPSVTTGVSATENSEEPATETISCSVSSRWVVQTVNAGANGERNGTECI